MSQCTGSLSSYGMSLLLVACRPAALQVVVRARAAVLQPLRASNLIGLDDHARFRRILPRLLKLSSEAGDFGVDLRANFLRVTMSEPAVVGLAASLVVELIEQLGK